MLIILPVPILYGFLEALIVTEHNDLVVTTTSIYPVGTSFNELPSPIIRYSIMIWENCHERLLFIKYSANLRFRSTPIKYVLSG